MGHKTYLDSHVAMRNGRLNMAHLTAGLYIKNVWRSMIKVVDSCWISSTEWSDTFSNFFVYGKKQESRKKIHHNRAKKFHLPEEV